MEIEPTKKCGKCKKLKLLNEFYKNKSNKDKLSCYCKICFNSRENPIIYIENKKCKKCNEVRDSSDFYKSKTSKYGLRPICKKCDIKLNGEYRKNNLAMVRRAHKKYYENNKEKRRVSGMKYRDEHRDNITIRNKRYIENLSDGYIRYMICKHSKLRKEDIPN